MVDIGAAGEESIGNRVSFLIGTDEYVLKQSQQLDLLRPINRDATSLGALKCAGKQDHSGQAEILTSAPDIQSVINLNQPDANGNLTEQACTIRIASNVGATIVNINFNAIFPGVSLRDLDLEGKARFVLDYELTQEHPTFS